MNDSVQLSLFDLMAETPVPVKPAPKKSPDTFTDADELRHALKRGSGFADGKMRIALMFSQDMSDAERVSFLREEYGIGGNSHTLLNGEHGFVDYRASGLTVSRRGFTVKTEWTWKAVYNTIREMIDKGEYLNADERARFETLRGVAVYPRLAISR